MKQTKQMKKNKFFKAGDLLILLILLVSIALTLWLVLKPKNASVVEIYKNGELYMQASLYENKKIVVDKNGRNIVEIKDGYVRIIEADCVGQECVHTAPIGKNGGVIVCLPNQLVVKIVGDIDAVI